MSISFHRIFQHLTATLLFVGACASPISRMSENSREYKIYYDGKLLLVSVSKDQKIVDHGDPQFSGDRAVYKISDEYILGSEVKFTTADGIVKKFKIEKENQTDTNPGAHSISNIFENISSYGLTFLELPTYSHQYTNQQNPVLQGIMTHSTYENARSMYASMIPTFGHETVHGIHAAIATSGGANSIGPIYSGFFIAGAAKGVKIKRLRFNRSLVASFVPSIVRSERYNSYVQRADSWSDVPYYLWDEWFAYIAGAQVDLKAMEMGLSRDSSLRGYMHGPMEFMFYSIAVAMAGNGQVEQDKEAIALMKLGIELSLAIVEEAKKFSHATDVQQPLRLLDNFKKDASSQGMRDYLKKLYGESWYLSKIESFESSFGN